MAKILNFNLLHSTLAYALNLLSPEASHAESVMIFDIDLLSHIQLLSAYSLLQFSFFPPLCLEFEFHAQYGFGLQNQMLGVGI
jgi:hypothetical protein